MTTIHSTDDFLTGFYRIQMMELKQRLFAIKTVLELPPESELHPSAVEEFAYLQLRFICELIALSVLAVHKDIKETNSKKLKEEWSANRIIKNLSKLHSEFYPQPFVPVIDEDGDVSGINEMTDHEFLSKQELLTLYGKCGDVLHRGTLKSLLDSPPKEITFDPILEWANKIIYLLECHVIPLIDGTHELWVLMNDGLNVWPTLNVVVQED